MLVAALLRLLQNGLDLLVFGVLLVALVGLVLVVVVLVVALVLLLVLLLLLALLLVVLLLLLLVLLLLLLVVLLLLLLVLPAAVRILRQKLAYLVDDLKGFLLLRREGLVDAAKLYLLELGCKSRDLRLVLGRERRLVRVALRLLLVGTRPRGELRAEGARVVERVLLPAVFFNIVLD